MKDFFPSFFILKFNGNHSIQDYYPMMASSDPFSSKVNFLKNIKYVKNITYK
jgi:hypothetical protein